MKSASQQLKSARRQKGKDRKTRHLVGKELAAQLKEDAKAEAKAANAAAASEAKKAKQDKSGERAAATAASKAAKTAAATAKAHAALATTMEAAIRKAKSDVQAMVDEPACRNIPQDLLDTTAKLALEKLKGWQLEAANAMGGNQLLPSKSMAEMKKGIAISKLTETAIKNLQSMHAA